jgi:PAS domain S-box-containing protein
LSPEDDYAQDPIAEFGIIEAQRHRERGIDIGMFLGLLKYYRQSYIDLVTQAGFEPHCHEMCRRFVDRFYDRIELGICVEWTRTDSGDILEELRSGNRILANEKNKYLTVFESLPHPAILVNNRFRIENLNTAAVEMLREERDYIKSIVETARGIILVLGTEGRIVRFNRFMEELSGYPLEEVKGKDWFETFLPVHCRDEAAGLFRTVLNGPSTHGNITPILTGDGKELDIEWYDRTLKDAESHTVGLLAIGQDVTERNRLERQLRQAQKLEAIGTLAGGIAHDFNNILAGIIGFTEIAMDEVSEWSTLYYDLNEILKSANRAKKLVRQILSFSRMEPKIEKSPVLVSHITREAVRFLRASLPSTIEIRLDMRDEEEAVLADPTQVHQMLMNLCTNAAHAMREKGGVLDVRLSIARLGAKATILHPNLKTGSYLRLSVSDTGHGMDGATMEKIFDPYFTTKPTGDGSGLGLAVVQGIVGSLNGAIVVRSEPGTGTTFEVYLPSVEQKPANDTTALEPIPEGCERILFIDDEDIILRAGKSTLQRLGYRVTFSKSATDALDLFRQDPDRFDLVITDYTMPHLTGEDVAREIMKTKPDIPIILCTGFNERISGDKAKRMGFREFIMKPFNRRDLVEAVRRALDGCKA